MEQLLADIRADVDRWEVQDEVSAHAAADLRHYLARLAEEYETSVQTAWRQALDMVPRP